LFCQNIFLLSHYEVARSKPSHVRGNRHSWKTDKGRKLAQNKALFGKKVVSTTLFRKM